MRSSFHSTHRHDTPEPVLSSRVAPMTAAVEQPEVILKSQAAGSGHPVICDSTPGCLTQAPPPRHLARALRQRTSSGSRWVGLVVTTSTWSGLAKVGEQQRPRRRASVRLRQRTSSHPLHAKPFSMRHLWAGSSSGGSGTFGAFLSTSPTSTRRSRFGNAISCDSITTRSQQSCLPCSWPSSCSPSCSVAL